MTSLSSFNQNIEGMDFLSAHRVLKKEKVKDAFAHIVGEKRDIISHATANWIKKMDFGSGEEDVIHSLFSHLFELEEKYKAVEQENGMMKEKVVTLEEKAYICALTKSLNRNFFNEFVDCFEKRKMKTENELSTFFFNMDLVKFKEINDNYGHGVGDEVLIAFSNRLSCVMRSEDNQSFDVEKLITKNFIVRIGGDEFIGKIDLSSEEDAEKLKARIQESMKIPFMTSIGSLHVGVSVGYQQIKKDISVKEVLKEADRKMYEDKRK